MLCGRRLREIIVVMVVMDDRRRWLVRDSGRLFTAEPIGFRTRCCHVDQVVLIMRVLFICGHEFRERNKFQRVDQLTLLG